MGQNQPRGNQSVLQTKHSKFNKVTYPIKLFDKLTQNMEVQLPCDQTSYKKWKKDIKIYSKQFQNKKYLVLPLDQDYNNGGMCSQSGTAKITYPKLPYILEDEIQLIKKKKNTFSEAEIWKLLYVLVEAKKQYLELAKNFSYELGNVNPKNIFLNEKNEIKLANPLSWPDYIDGYKNAVLRQPAYLSPEDLKLLELGALNNDSNSRSEDFSIGMTLLSVGLVENFDYLYNFNRPSFNSKQFQEKLILWKTTLYYSEILRAVVLSLLQTYPQQRLTSNQVRDFLKPHVNNIKASKPLTVSNVNSKIQTKIEDLVKQLPDLIRYRFEKYSPQKLKQPKQSNSIPKKSINNSLPKDSSEPKDASLPKNTKQSLIQNLPASLNINQTSKNLNTNPIRNDRTPSILPPETQYQIGRDIHQMIQPFPVQNNPITRVKSQTRFTYSNRPLENVSPSKFVASSQNVAVNQQANLIPHQNTQNNNVQTFAPTQQNQRFFQPINMVNFPRINKITYESSNQQTVRPMKEPSLIVSTDHMIQSKKPTHTTILTPAQKKAEQIAQRLVRQGLKHTDSQIHVQQPNRESSSTEINKLEFLQAGNIIPLRTEFQDKSKATYHTYAQVLVNSDFAAVWNEFLNLIHRPETYFSELQHKITVSDQTVEAPPGKVKIESNREEGKIHLENVSSKCIGEILGGVSKNSPQEVQVWFNSSYEHDGKPFPTSEYFTMGLQKLKEKVERKKNQ